MKRRTFLKSSGAVIAAAAIPISFAMQTKPVVFNMIPKELGGTIGGTIPMLTIEEFEARYIQPAIEALCNDFNEQLFK